MTPRSQRRRRSRGSSGRRAGALLLSLVLGACAGGAGPPGREPARVDPAALRASLSALAADSMEGRRAGSAGAARAARFLASELRRYGVEPAYGTAAGRDSAFFQPVPLVRGDDGSGLRLLQDWESYDATPPERRIRDVNVVGVVRGRDPALRHEAIVVGAHYDHLGVGAPVAGDSIYNGADDDASGVVTVLEIARALASGRPPARTVVFLLSTAEESGLLGTLWYIREPVVPLARTVADLQVEMVGRPDTAAGGAGRAWLTGFTRSSIGAQLAEAGIPISDDPRPAQRFFERSDNIAYACEGIPAHTLSSFGLHGDYHAPSDELDRIDFAHLRQVVEAATRAVRLLADGERPTWLPGGDPSRDPTVCG